MSKHQYLKIIIAVADLENEKGWFQFIVALARRKIFVGHAHFGSREDTYLSHDSASKLPLTLSARDAYIYAQKSPTLPRGMHISGGSRGDLRVLWNPPFSPGYVQTL